MELEFENRLDPQYDSLEGEYRLIMEVAFRELNVKENYEVDVSLVDDPTIHEINRDYRGVDRITDVISFAFLDDESEVGKIVGDAPRLLGEIFVCVPQALRQAKEIGNTDERELSFLFCHGLLHLLGYDHMTKEDEDIMFPLQEKILEAVKKERDSRAN
ncbi:MAG: rRNA maturation RNase YbeY [Bacilli bacterium]|nr:rRNA maturation RNase YbeY [Bacilli bacterium]